MQYKSLILQPPYSTNVKRIEPKPFIAQSLRIRVLQKHSVESICLRAEVLGCNVPKGKTCYLV